MAILSMVPALLLALASCTPAVAAQSASEYFVHDLPGAPKEPFIKMHAGYVTTTDAATLLPSPSSFELMWRNIVATQSVKLSR